MPLQRLRRRKRRLTISYVAGKPGANCPSTSGSDKAVKVTVLWRCCRPDQCGNPAYTRPANEDVEQEDGRRLVMATSPRIQRWNKVDECIDRQNDLSTTIM